MDETTRTQPNEQSTTLDDDLRNEARDAGAKTEHAADKAADKAEDMAEDAKDGLSKVGHSVSNAVEDLIPGDSDRDGH
jgi:hypothetical protein